MIITQKITALSIQKKNHTNERYAERNLLKRKNLNPMFLFTHRRKQTNVKNVERDSKAVEILKCKCSFMKMRNLYSVNIEKRNFTRMTFCKRIYKLILIWDRTSVNTEERNLFIRNILKNISSLIVMRNLLNVNSVERVSKYVRIYMRILNFILERSPINVRNEGCALWALRLLLSIYANIRGINHMYEMHEKRSSRIKEPFPSTSKFILLSSPTRVHSIVASHFQQKLIWKLIWSQSSITRKRWLRLQIWKEKQTTKTNKMSNQTHL